MKTLKELFLAELADVYDAEHQLIKALPTVARAATCPQLQKALLSHLEETEGHAKMVEQVFECFDKKAQGKTCEATKGLVQEGDEIVAEFKGSPAINAALISAVQKIEHYEIASYGCLLEWAGILGNQEAAELLEAILDEEKGANESLTDLARESSNDEALGESEEDPLAAAGVKRSRAR